MARKSTLDETLDLTIAELIQCQPEMAHFMVMYRMGCVGCEFDHLHSLRTALAEYAIDPQDFMRAFKKWLAGSRFGGDWEKVEDYRNLMEKAYTLIDDLLNLAGEIPEDAIVSRTYFEDERVKAILFGFAPGQELSEHTASQPAILQFLEGEADLVLGDEKEQAGPGTWAHMPARLPHSIFARTKTLMLLLLFKS